MTRTRSEYRLSQVKTEPPSVERVTRRVFGADRDVLAAVNRDITGMEHEHSFVVIEAVRVVAMACVMAVDAVHHVDPHCRGCRPHANWRRLGGKGRVPSSVMVEINKT